MTKNNFLLLAVIMLVTSCSKTEEPQGARYVGKILMLKVDYLTHAFEGGTETSYTADAPTFTIGSQYLAPGDAGNITLKYEEAHTIVFDGDIIRAGKGKIKYPENILPAGQFNYFLTADFVSHDGAPIENIFNPDHVVFGEHEYDYVWSAVQSLVKVREYLKNNPTGTIKLFLYTPSAGIGNPADADWIIFMKN